jgi:translation elongation factor EF-Tu-like GTPase
MMMGHINHSKCKITERRTSTIGRKDGKKERNYESKRRKERKRGMQI